ncbi:MAG: DUF952 domain-containing protein [Pseudomonadota bacterium]
MKTPSIREVYRIVSDAEWREMRRSGMAPRRDIDRQDGYFHLSTKSQVLETATLHFDRQTDLWVLAVPVDILGDALKFEWAPKRGEAFPHYYGDLALDHVIRATPLIWRDGVFQFGEDEAVL